LFGASANKYTSKQISQSTYLRPRSIGENTLEFTGDLLP
jgi:hypothetical protein